MSELACHGKSGAERPYLEVFQEEGNESFRIWGSSRHLCQSNECRSPTSKVTLRLICECTCRPPSGLSLKWSLLPLHLKAVIQKTQNSCYDNRFKVPTGQQPSLSCFWPPLSGIPVTRWLWRNWIMMVIFLGFVQWPVQTNFWDLDLWYWRLLDVSPNFCDFEFHVCLVNFWWWRL